MWVPQLFLTALRSRRGHWPMAVVKLKADLRQVLNSSEFWYLLNTNTEPNWICERGVELFVLYASLFHQCFQWITGTFTEYLGRRINIERRNTDTALKIYRREMKTLRTNHLNLALSSYLPSIIIFSLSWLVKRVFLEREREREREGLVKSLMSQQ